MERIIFVLVLVLASTIGGDCYRIDGTEIQNCETIDSDDPIDSEVDVEYQLNCSGCRGYSYIQYIHGFTIKCDDGSSSINIESSIQYILPFCNNNTFIMHLRDLSTRTNNNFMLAVDHNNISDEVMEACNDENGNRRELIKRLAATLLCEDSQPNCFFLFNESRCQVSYYLFPVNDNILPTEIKICDPSTLHPEYYLFDCSDCRDDSYVTLRNNYTFHINCYDDLNMDSVDSNTYNRGLIRIPSCSRNLASQLENFIICSTDTSTSEVYECGDATKVVQLIAATLFCNGLRNSTQECCFMFNNTICNVTYERTTTSMTTTIPTTTMTTTIPTTTMTTTMPTTSITTTIQTTTMTTTIPTSTPSISSTTTTLSKELAEKLKVVLPPIFVILTVILLAILIAVVSVTVCYRRMARSRKESINRDVYASIDENSTVFQLTPRDINTTNTEVNNNNNITQDAMYTDIMENNTGGRIRSNSNDHQDIQPSDPVQSVDSVEFKANVLYAGYVEGEVADMKLYQQLPYIKNQSSYLMEANPLYNFSPAKPFIEPSNTLPELESAFKCCLYEIETGALTIGEMFASGQFGVVYRGTYRTVMGDIPVAVKALKDSVTKDTLVTFMREAAIIGQFSHPNVLRLLGVKTTEQPWMIVTELLKTELRELLLKFRDSQIPINKLRQMLMKFTVEIAGGMEYLAMRNFVHRDLAARNVLVAKDFTIRIADFGMSREVGSEKNYYTSSGGVVPLRWTAPEAVFFQKYSEKSDVWSYGMTLYEIWTLGDKPWGSATNEEIIVALTSPITILPPPSCPEVVGRIMLETWKLDKIERPTFIGVRAMLSTL